MRDVFRYTRLRDYNADEPDIYGIGNTRHRTQIRKEQTRRARRVLKQQLRDQLALMG